MFFALVVSASAACRNPLPHASGYANPAGGSCPSGFYSSGNSCVPSGSSSLYAFANPGGGSCPSGYYSSGNSCVASSSNSCHAFFNGGGSCPSGYYSSGKSCVSNWV